MKNRFVKIAAVAALVSGLVLIRAYASSLFYDPFIEYFKNDFLQLEIPEIDVLYLSGSMFFRFCLNSTISILILKVLFQKEANYKFLMFLYGSVFTVFMCIYLMLLRGNFEMGYVLPFYVRRLLIHPVLLIVLLPVYFVKRRISVG